ncbi:Plasmodium exported protein, unknown function [Plasmodium knowlesi strain H]|uniref:Uncharacterized protein n=3 Tax=Plasmodium knowlesi TaxID=5850 RepID=A0A5K1UEL8_PLAKH|nr:Plasmodium exported protein, unknown function [Plasmodium knowlesi strain H]OTN65625.1 Uncharacterized protein PKNOH_S110117500 [Plasmodium knowlesi]CAA9989791.1 Plasmodium exported protein, unknown function [Plasmodium knowlesi strain H]SBO22910.1 Plasmodium exported protein, unknown function [Plasmodium knowlesi strain H]SBO22987.1 Plasmodium exported protein, unknown function [Plasmodium knowlesi strain H]VVS79265.1 Plasmodium exported protein, unknown function [Plasmodium knowlesi strai|eukprot:XP_002260514.1 hypothetical protein, conserved in Plasmodium species [Plasmodium knowlesi strain H]
MKPYSCLVHINLKHSSASDRVRNMSTWKTSTSSIKPRNKNITINTITFFTNIIYLSLLLCIFQGSFDYRDVNKFSTKYTKKFNGKATGITFKRNLAQDYYDNVPEVPEENVLEPDDATTETVEFHNSSYPLEEDELDDSENLDELIEACEKEFEDILIDITDQFVEFTDDMNHYWCDKMWEIVWCKYADNVYTSVMKNLQDPKLSLNEKKNIFKFLMEWFRKDFKCFLKLIKEEWDLRDEPEQYLER